MSSPELMMRPTFMAWTLVPYPKVMLLWPPILSQPWRLPPG